MIAPPRLDLANTLQGIFSSARVFLVLLEKLFIIHTVLFFGFLMSDSGSISTTASATFAPTPEAIMSPAAVVAATLRDMSVTAEDGVKAGYGAYRNDLAVAAARIASRDGSAADSVRPLSLDWRVIASLLRQDPPTARAFVEATNRAFDAAVMQTTPSAAHPAGALTTDASPSRGLRLSSLARRGDRGRAL